ncbi:MAG: hypothetical protein IPL40_13345 [Proteobacteria bacterium]|nr:hypothetical protein [Pseudomonadota bacterium]
MNFLPGHRSTAAPTTTPLLMLGLLAATLVGACRERPTLLLELAPSGIDPAAVDGQLTLGVIELATGRLLGEATLPTHALSDQRRLFEGLSLVDGHSYRLRVDVHFAEASCTSEQPELHRRALGLSPSFVYTADLQAVEVYLGCADGTRAGGNPELRVYHTATWVPEGGLQGRVLLVGGVTPSLTALELETPGETKALRTIESFDPVSGQFTPLQVELSSARFLQQAALLDSGDVLLSGGFAPAQVGDATIFVAVKTVERLRDGRIAALPDLHEGRGAHGQLLLPSGQVAVFGGIGSEGAPLLSVERFDPRGADSSSSLSLDWPALLPTVVDFGDGRHVLVAGGAGPEDRDITGQVFCFAAPCDCGDPPCARALAGFGAGQSRFGAPGVRVPCAGGKGGAIYLVGGGREDPETKVDTMYNDIYCLDTKGPERLARVGELHRRRSGHSATLVAGPAGPRLFVAGGGGELPDTPSTAELVPVDCACGTIASDAIKLITLRGARFGHTATLLPDGTVLLVGSLLGAAAERFSPDS